MRNSLCSSAANDRGIRTAVAGEGPRPHIIARVGTRFSEATRCYRGPYTIALGFAKVRVRVRETKGYGPRGQVSGKVRCRWIFTDTLAEYLQTLTLNIYQHTR